MRKNILLFAFFLAPLCAFAQQGNQSLPSGSGGGISFGIGAGTAQAQTVNPSTAIVTLTTGLQVCWLPIAANTAAAPTLSVSALSAKPITKYGTVALVANDITTVGVACAIYDGTEFQLQVPLAGGVFSGSLSTGSGASAAGATATGGFAAVEAPSTGWTPTGGQDYCRADNTLHNFVCALNGAAEAPEILGTCATANALSLFTAASTLGCGLADFTYASHTLTMGALGVLNLLAAGNNSVALPNGDCSAGATGFHTYIAANVGGNGQVCTNNGNAGFTLAVASAAASTATTCTNQVLSAISSIAAPTCHTIVGADMGNTLTLTGAESAATHLTATNCAANGTAANPSVVTCGSAAAGMFSCATNASTGTCQVNTTAVTANSEIFITQDQADGAAGQLNVTCNTGLDLAAAAPLLKTKAAGASFTINLGTVTANPACFEYFIVN